MHANTARVGLVALSLALAQTLLAGAPAGLPETASASLSGSLTLVQAVPGRTVDIRIDERPIRRAVDAGVVVGPVRLSAGRHRITFVSPGAGSVSAWVRISAASPRDVVLHRPAARSGKPVVSTFPTPTRRLAPGTSRLVVSSTASIVPADVRLDGRVVFTNIANGEAATTRVRPGRHRVTLVPTGRAAPTVLGPVDVAVAPGTVTIVYAFDGPGTGPATRSSTPSRCAPAVAWPPEPSTPARPGWRATCPSACSAQADRWPCDGPCLGAHRLSRWRCSSACSRRARGRTSRCPPRSPGPCGCRAARCCRCGRSAPTVRGSSPCRATPGPQAGGGAGPGSAMRSEARCSPLTSTRGSAGLGPYAELYATRPGARVVLRSDDLRQVFRIRSVRLVPRGSVASRPGLYSPRGRAGWSSSPVRRRTTSASAT